MDTCPLRSQVLKFRGRSCTNWKTRPPRQARRVSCTLGRVIKPDSPPTRRILPGFLQDFSLTRRQERRGAARAKPGRRVPPAALGGRRESRCCKRTGALAGSGNQDGSGGAARRSRGGRRVSGPGRPAGACAPRACGAGWQRGGTFPDPASVYQQTAAARQRRIPTS